VWFATVPPAVTAMFVAVTAMLVAVASWLVAVALAIEPLTALLANAVVNATEPPELAVPDTTLSALLSCVVDLVHPVGAAVCTNNITEPAGIGSAGIVKVANVLSPRKNVVLLAVPLPNAEVIILAVVVPVTLVAFVADVADVAVAAFPVILIPQVPLAPVPVLVGASLAISALTKAVVAN
jgi:hypothetical protein